MGAYLKGEIPVDKLKIAFRAKHIWLHDPGNGLVGGFEFRWEGEGRPEDAPDYWSLHWMEQKNEPTPGLAPFSFMEDALEVLQEHRVGHDLLSHTFTAFHLLPGLPEWPMFTFEWAGPYAYQVRTMHNERVFGKRFCFERLELASSNVDLIYNAKWKAIYEIADVIKKEKQDGRPAEKT